MKLLVTRPAGQAAEWVAQLQSLGIDAAALPLIGIAPAADDGAVLAAWARLDEQRLVVFVSPNAAEQFFARRPLGSVWPVTVKAASPGPGTTQALVALGVQASQIVAPAADAPQFDSEALWQQLAPQDWRGARVLIVRGDGGREWLADRLREHGAVVDMLAAYQRCAPRLDDAQRDTLAGALAEPQRHVWFFSSSEAVEHLIALAPTARWNAARALATHPRIAGRARAAGFGVVMESRPTLEAVAACLQSPAP
jgi:uroporphyrinogen-III synthase